MSGVTWERADRSIDVVDRTSSNDDGPTAYLEKDAGAAADSLDVAAAVNTIRHALGARKVKYRIQSTSPIESLRIGIVYWSQNETDDTGAPMGFNENNGAVVSGDVINGAGVYCSPVYEFPAEAQNYELRIWSQPVGDVELFCWESQ